MIDHVYEFISYQLFFLKQYLVENHPTKPAHIQYNDSLVLTLQEGNFFGEIALLSGKPRQATVKASGVVSVLVIGRDAFDRLCGSLIDILQRNMTNYSNMELPEPEPEKGMFLS
jgi:CRP-like cAMP-binding protein